MKLRNLPTVVIAVLFVVSAFSYSDMCIAQDDAEGCKDNPYFSRMPNFYIWESADREFDAYQFYDGKEFVTKEGRMFRNRYYVKEGVQKPSELQIRRNYTNALKSIGGIVVYEGDCAKCVDNRANRVLLTGKAVKDNKELWIEVVPWDDGMLVEYWFTVLETERMKQDITANDMLAALNKDGFIALYINFDTGKYTIKPESKPIIDEMVKLLKDNPNLTVNIEGHTDNVGDAKSNKVLSEQRAKAVVDAIVKQGVDAKRLSSVGWGQEKPVADNRTEEGRAKNRPSGNHKKITSTIEKQKGGRYETKKHSINSCNSFLYHQYGRGFMGKICFSRRFILISLSKGVDSEG